jgi:hypothetical protein
LLKLFSPVKSRSGWVTLFSFIESFDCEASGHVGPCPNCQNSFFTLTTSNATSGVADMHTHTHTSIPGSRAGADVDVAHLTSLPPLIISLSSFATFKLISRLSSSHQLRIISHALHALKTKALPLIFFFFLRYFTFLRATLQYSIPSSLLKSTHSP